MYTAPDTLVAGTSVTITVTSPEIPVSASAVVIIASPLPSISNVTPTSIPAGVSSTITITGHGFTPLSQLVVTPLTPSYTSTLPPFSPRSVTATTVTYQVSVPSAALGPLSLTVSTTGPDATVSAPVTINAVLPVGSGAAVFASLPIFHVATYSASGSADTGTCSGTVGSTTLTSCSFGSDSFFVGQGISILGGGVPAQTAPITTPPLVTRQGHDVAGPHTYCYVVDTADPLEGISAPSPQTCLQGEPSLSLQTWNSLATTTSNVGPSPAFLWYVSEDNGPFQLVIVEMHSSYANDVGQRPGTRGGWPNNLPSSNPNIEKNEDFFTSITNIQSGTITVADPLTASFANVSVLHDDTRAVQSAIDAAVSAGGGTVQFDKGTYNIRRPSFQYVENNSLAYPHYTTSLALEPWYANYPYLYIPNGATGNINLQGQGIDTQIVTPPDHGAMSQLIAVGAFGRPDYTTTGLFTIDEVSKGATQVVVTGSVDGSTLHAGDDIWIYSGSFQAPCQGNQGMTGDCHYSELNTISAIQDGVITLVYPASKHYYNDGASSYGLVKMPVTPHNVAIQHLTINTYSPITATGLVYGMLVNDVTINGFISQGPFGGGFKRDVTIENSTWGFGAGDASYAGTDEYDQCTNYAFVNNNVHGYAAPGAEGPSLMARIYATEGSSQFSFRNNHFDHVALYFDETTDDVISNNEFIDGIVNMGRAYENVQTSFSFGPAQDNSFVSFDSQLAADVDTNTFTEDATFLPPFILRVGPYQSSTIVNNTITYSGPNSIPAITAYSGSVSGNIISMSGTGNALGIALVPDQGPRTPASSFMVYGNTVSVQNPSAGLLIANPGFSDTAPSCIQNNTWNMQGSTMALVPNNQAKLVVSCVN